MTPASFVIPGDLETLTGGFIYERRLLEALRAAGRRVRHVALPEGFPDPGPREVAASARALAALPPEEPVILDGFVSGALETAALAHLRAPFVAMVHHPLALEAGLSAERAAWLYRTERDNLARAAHVLVPSPHTARVLAGRYGVAPDRITVARPGVDRPAGRPAAPARPPLILSVGILHPRKGHDVLIAALGRLRHLDWQAVIVGRDWDAAHAAALRRQVADADLGGRLRLAGEVDRAALDRLYRSARIFALASRYEGYGLVFDEALAAGLPIVACRTGAVPETVPEAAGILVPPDAPEDFAAALRAMLSDEALYGACRAAAERAGARLATWADTAAIAGAVLDRVAAARSEAAGGGCANASR